MAIEQDKKAEQINGYNKLLIIPYWLSVSDIRVEMLCRKLIFLSVRNPRGQMYDML